jgi:hypothetical protein
MAGARHGMCELTHGMAWGTAWAQHAVCESALSVPKSKNRVDLYLVIMEDVDILSTKHSSNKALKCLWYSENSVRMYVTHMCEFMVSERKWPQKSWLHS